jgi:exosortase
MTNGLSREDQDAKAGQAFFRSPLNFMLLALGISLAWVYWPTFVALAGAWETNSQYSHGFVVPIFAAYLLWRRRGLLTNIRPSVWGAVLLILGLGLRGGGTYLYFEWLQSISLLPCLAGVCLLGSGWRGLRWSWPAIAFLVFMVPLPYRLETGLAGPLQTAATISSTWVLQTMGFVAFSEGNVIHLGEIRIGVVEACSGLAMLMIFFALTTAVCLISKRPFLEKALIFTSAIPIAILANQVRIIVTAILHKTAGSQLADYVFHDLAGWLMMPLALLLLLAEMRLFAWLVVERETRPALPARLPGLRPTGLRPAKPAKKHKAEVANNTARRPVKLPGLKLR